MCFPLVTHSFRVPNHRYEIQRSGPVPTQRLAWRSDSCKVCHADNGADLSGAWYEAANTMKWGLRKCRKKKSSLILMMISIRIDRNCIFLLLGSPNISLGLDSNATSLQRALVQRYTL